MSLLYTLQTLIHKRLQEDTDLSTQYKILIVNQSDAYSLLEKSNTSSLGTCICILPPLPKHVAPNLPGPIFYQTNLIIQIIHQLYSSNPNTNLLTIAETITQSLHFWTPPITQWNSALELSSPNPWRFSYPSPTQTILELEFNIQTHL